VYYNQGNACHLKGEYGQALADLTEAIRLNPEYVLAYHDRAWLLATCPDAWYRDGKQAFADATRTGDFDRLE
jgi:hypothetical protein